MGMITFAELEKRTANAVDQGDLVAGMIPAVGVTLLCADACAGKTTLMAAITACVGLGRQFARHATTEGNVAWVYQDRGSAGLAVHVGRAVRGTGGSDLPMWVWDRDDGPWATDDDQKVDQLLAFLDEHETRLLVIDNLRRVTSADESRSADMSAVFDVFHKLAAGRRAVVVLHHSTKKGDVVRGSGDIRANADSIVFLTAHGVDGNDIRLKIENHYGATHKVELRREIDDERLVYTPKSAPAENRVEDALGERVCDALRRRGKLNATALKNELRVGKAALNRAVGGLKASGRIREEAGSRKAREFSLVSTSPESAQDGSNPASPPSRIEGADIGDTPPPPPLPCAGPGLSRSPKGGETDGTGPPGTATGAETVRDRSGQVGLESSVEREEGCGIKTPALSTDPMREVNSRPVGEGVSLEGMIESLVDPGGFARLQDAHGGPTTPEMRLLLHACSSLPPGRPEQGVPMAALEHALAASIERDRSGCDANRIWTAFFAVQETRDAS